MACKDRGIKCGNKYTTLLDLARQAKILSGETACFEGGVQVGIPFSGYPSGVDYATVVSLGIVDSDATLFNTPNVSGTTYFDVENPLSPDYDARFSGWTYNCDFNGDSGSTCNGETGYTYCIATGIGSDVCDGTTGFTEDIRYSWTNPLFFAGTSGLTLPITNLSADTQTVGPFWTLTQTGCTGDHIIATQYTGYTITYSFFDVFSYESDLYGCFDVSGIPALSASTCSLDPSLGSGYTIGISGSTTSFSGFTQATQENFSASTLDYRGPLTYLHSLEDALIDNRTVTTKLRVTGGASASTLGYVLTQVDDIGTAEWRFNSASADTNTFVTSGVLDSSDDLILTYNTGGSVPPIDLSGLVFTGGSGTCIDELYVNTITGCSDTITIGENIRSNTSTVSGPNAFAFSKDSTILGGCDNASILGGNNNVIGSAVGGSFNSAIIGGQDHIVEDLVRRAVILGGQGITATSTNTAYVSQFNIDVQPMKDNTLGHVLVRRDIAGGAGREVGDVEYRDVSSIVFSGGSGNCITDLYVTNIHGCSPITVHDPTQHVGSLATGINSIAWGTGTTASGDFSHAEGDGSSATNDRSHAEGKDTLASGNASHAEGEDTIASGEDSHAEGKATEATGEGAHSEGGQTTAGDDFTHAGGFNSHAMGEKSFIHGEDSTVNGDNGAILGGFNNNIGVGSTNSSIIGGVDNIILEDSISSGIFVGSGNTINDEIGSSVIVGGIYNNIEVVSGSTCGCPCDYEYDPVAQNCIKLTATTVASGGAIVLAPKNYAYGDYGARFCLPHTLGSPTNPTGTCGDGADTADYFDTGSFGDGFWGNSVGVIENGRLNQVGVNNPLMVSSPGVWFGFSECLDLPADGQYLFALAGDNEIRAQLNSTLVVHNPWDGTASSDRNFKIWWVFAVDLNAGANTINLEGAQVGAPGPFNDASFGCEIIGPFPYNTFTANTDFNYFSGATGISDYTSKTVFSSISKTGSTFDTEVNACPPEYLYSACYSACVETIECSGGASNVIAGGQK